MKNKIINLFLCGIIILNITGCNSKNDKIDKEQDDKELFLIGNTLDDGRVIFFTFDVPYIKGNNESYVSEALINHEITIDDFIKELDYVESVKDGGSKLYQYNKNKKIFGTESFYVMVCNSLDNVRNIFVAKNNDILHSICTIKIDDLKDVSMAIKENTLTNTSATVIITDTSSRNNVYGNSYKIEKKENGLWTELKPKNEMNFTSIGYVVGEDHTLEFNINWEYFYGKLDSGEYRILKDTSEAGEGTNHYITAEFVIK